MRACVGELVYGHSVKGKKVLKVLHALEYKVKDVKDVFRMFAFSYAVLSRLENSTTDKETENT